MTIKRPSKGYGLHHLALGMDDVTYEDDKKAEVESVLCINIVVEMN